MTFSIPAPDLGPCEVVANGVRYVREATLFAALARIEELETESQLGPQTQRCPNPDCSLASCGSGYQCCPKCEGELVPA